MLNPGATYWFVTRMCDCGGPCLRCFTDGKHLYAHCDKCDRTWNAKTHKEIAKEAKPCATS